MKKVIARFLLHYFTECILRYQIRAERNIMK